MYTPDIAERITSYSKQQSAANHMRLSALSLSLLSVITDLQDKHVPDTFKVDEDGTASSRIYCIECTSRAGSVIIYPCPTILGIEEGLKYV